MVENRSADQAFAWLEGCEQALLTLAHHPERFVLARENDAFEATNRELHYGLRHKATHRAIFEVRKDEVLVYSIRHLSQRDLSPSELVQPPAR